MRDATSRMSCEFINPRTSAADLDRKPPMTIPSSRFAILVCGGRDYADAAKVYRVLDRMLYSKGVTTLIHGGATGADALANSWAEQNQILVRAFPADWKRLGKSAGPIRNAQMLVQGNPDLVVAFPGGRGTSDMVRRARDFGVPVYEVSA